MFLCVVSIIGHINCMETVNVKLNHVTLMWRDDEMATSVPSFNFGLVLMKK